MTKPRLRIGDQVRITTASYTQTWIVRGVDLTSGGPSYRLQRIVNSAPIEGEFMNVKDSELDSFPGARLA